MSSYSDYVEQRAIENYIRDAIARKLRKGRSPEWIHEEDEYPMELILEVQSMLEDEKHDIKRYEESLARTGEPVPLEEVENIDIRVDARALQAYARARGVSTLDLTEEERRQFILPRDKC